MTPNELLTWPAGGATSTSGTSDVDAVRAHLQQTTRDAIAVVNGILGYDVEAAGDAEGYAFFATEALEWAELALPAGNESQPES